MMSAKESLLKFLKEEFDGRATDWVAEIVEAADGNLNHKELATSICGGKSVTLSFRTGAPTCVSFLRRGTTMRQESRPGEYK